MKLAAFLSLVLLASGCEIILGIEDANTGANSGGDGEPIDERDDAGVGPGGGDTGEAFNGLGLLCGPDHIDNGFDGGCPAGPCVTAFADWFDPGEVNGVCTLECFDGDQACFEGYQGPPDGQPVCIAEEGGDVPPMCGILCEGGEENLGCPPEMPCLPFSDEFGNFIASGCGSPFWVQAGQALR